MGIYLNPGNKAFREALNSEIYIDKSELIGVMNGFIDTLQKYVCVSRPRRFGKSVGLNMLAAYYSLGVDSAPLFDSLKIGADSSYKKYLNRYDVLRINMQEFLSIAGSADGMLSLLKKNLVRELEDAYPAGTKEAELIFAMQEIYARTGHTFVILIDEWDCLFREYGSDIGAQKRYLDFLRLWLKDQPYVSLAYMTGILPIKKYGTHSALNMFYEYSMTDPGGFARYFGFTETEVRELCARYGMSFEEARGWYDGYNLSPVGEPLPEEPGKLVSIYNPQSVVEAMLRHGYGNYWNRTETYEALKVYIQMNMDGLKDSVTAMLGGDSVRVNTDSFANDMTTFASKDDVLTLLVHLGYLTYNGSERSVSIPNNEVAQEYITAVSNMEWGEVTRSIENSKKLLEALWNLDGEAVARGIDLAHNEISILKYNDENSLSCTINLAFYCAREYYNIFRELPSGKGFADICFVPRLLHADRPAAVIELKWNRSAAGAIAQIKEKNYTASLSGYSGDILLAGINYDKACKTHSCIIEKVRKP